MKAIIILAGILGFLFLLYILMATVAICTLNKRMGCNYFDFSAKYRFDDKQQTLRYIKNNYSYKYNHNDMNRIDYKNIFIICKKNNIDYEDVIKILEEKSL